jgi:hypothetical protein
VLTVLLYCICCTAALAYTLAAVSPGLMVAMPLLCFILIISLILCGFMIRAPAVPVYWCVARGWVSVTAGHSLVGSMGSCRLRGLLLELFMPCL